jgi:CHAD domain-containing protein
MAYRLKPGRSLGNELSRIVRKECERALRDMDRSTDKAEAVYDARKRVKKIRAILHLLRVPLGRDYREYNGALRTVAHQLSAPRDADAALEIMATIRRHYPKVVTRTILDAVRQGLTPKKRGAASRLRPGTIRRELRQAAKTMPRRIRKVADRPVVRAGLRRGYSRARQAMREVTATPEDVRFHAWRRRVKDHWYHLRLFEAVHPHLRTRMRLLEGLERWLGDDHNLVVLRATVLDAPSTFGDERTTAIVLGCIEKYHATLRKRSLMLGRRLFAPTPRAFGHSIRRWL